MLSDMETNAPHLGDVPMADLLRELTRIPTKEKAYRREVYFRQGFDLLQFVFGSNAVQFAQETAILVIKPDGIEGNKIPSVLEFLELRGFEFFAAFDIDMSGKTWRELWRYQLTSATLDRLAINDLLFTQPCLLLLLKDKFPQIGIPASVRLTSLKGASNMENQADDCFRKVVGQVNRILSCVHVADEPADVIRELALLLPHAAQQAALHAMVAGRDTVHGMDRIHAAVALGEYTRLDFDLTAACGRLKSVLGQTDTNVTQSALQIVAQAAEGEKVSFRDLAAKLAESTANYAIWDLVIVGSFSMIYDEIGYPKLIKNPPPDAWASHTMGKNSLQPS